jgi:uncharacterized protein (DUF1800 family)
MATLAERQVAHVWRRMGFGPTAADIAAGVKVGPAAVVEDLLSRPLTTATDWAFTTGTDWQEQERWLGQLLHNQATQKNPLQERMAWVLANLVVAGIDGTAYFDDVRDHHYRLRADPLGAYSTLVRQTATMPGLLKYLTGHLNEYRHPNQNFARELMELFCLGRTHALTGKPNYAEHDVQELARACTGWRYDWGTGKVAFNASYWDPGPKTIFNVDRGAAKLANGLTVVFAHPSYLYHVPRRLYLELMGTEPTVDQLKALAPTWGRTGDIRAVVSAIVRDPAFVDVKAIATKIKTPVELVTSAARVLGVDLRTQSLGWELRDKMGQHPLLPPNVAGWPAGTRWLSSSVLVTWNEIVNRLVAGVRGQANGVVAKVHAIGQTSATNQAIRLTALTEATTSTRQAIAAFTAGGTWNLDRAAGTVALCLVSPEFFVS